MPVKIGLNAWFSRVFFLLVQGFGRCLVVIFMKQHETPPSDRGSFRLHSQKSKKPGDPFRVPRLYCIGGLAAKKRPDGRPRDHSALAAPTACSRLIRSLTKFAPREAKIPVSSVPTHGQANSTPSAV